MATADKPAPVDKQNLAQQAYDKALQYELDYGCCPQCVLAAIQETVGVIDDSVIKASHGLSGGGGLMGQGACGALTGGLVALSAKRGRDRDKLDKGRFISNFKKGRELVERFRQEFGGITCEQLQQCFTGRTYDMWNEDEYKAFDAARGQQCARATATVTKWVVEML
ncbi:C_GCAxxG_C_C family probable redox protein [Sulfuritortus calidifontis]|uniref:C_GCAxxG_C_C family probable redox protein n=1 Tax=Sulfuritortus calidifontis TaxID=1914471 RepID=A0A4R3JXU1_9PROT|nr:C-GCAxxG-C-C family protein [Sulfuritortus calidifontis]TCS73317.1 C_GCAxxG_C_C family probable redox protein [Sulfuritortus calidifontis]